MEYTIRDRGRDLGSFTLEQLESMLDDHQIGMMAEVYDRGQWITVAELIDDLEEADRRKSNIEDEDRRQRAASLALQQKATDQRNEDAQRKRETELAIQKERTRQMKVELEREAYLVESRGDLQNHDSAQNYTGVTAAGNWEPHRGSTILVLGILSLTFCSIFTGIPAWVMGNGDLEKIKAGNMDPAGKGPTNAGMICGIVSCVITIALFGLAVLGSL